MPRHSNIVVVLAGFRVRLFFVFVRAFCMRLLNSIFEIDIRSFACWFCLDFSIEIAVQTDRSKGMYKG